MTPSLLAPIESSIFRSAWSSRIFLLLSGAIYPLAFAPFEFWPAAFISLACLLQALLSPRNLSYFKIGFYWGLGCFVVGASWVYVSIHEFGFVPLPAAALLSLLFAAYLAVFKGLFSYLIGKFLTANRLPLLVLLAPSLWLLSEYLQSVVFSGFPWLLAGYSQMDSPLATIASWLGIYGVSWFVLAISGSLVLLLNRQSSNMAAISLTLLVSLIICATVSRDYFERPENQSPKKSLDIALVQPNIAQSIKWDRKYFAQIIDTLISESKPLWGADLVVWPEGAIPTYLHQVNDIVLDLESEAINRNSHLILGIPEYDPTQQRSFVALKAFGKQRQSYHKQVLVPFGEYVPLQNWLRGLIQFLDLPMSNFTPALETQSAMQFNGFSVVPAICYEIVYPGIVRDLVIESQSATNPIPQLIVTVSNDAWFGDSFGPYQHFQMARMRSLELGMPLVRATNDGITAMVDAKGQVIEQLPRYQQGSLRRTLFLDNIITPYRRFGLIGLFIIIALTAITSLIYIKRQP